MSQPKLTDLIKEEAAAYRAYVREYRGQEVGRIKPAQVRAAKENWLRVLAQRDKLLKKLAYNWGVPPWKVLQLVLGGEEYEQSRETRDS